MANITIDIERENKKGFFGYSSELATAAIGIYSIIFSFAAAIFTLFSNAIPLFRNYFEYFATLGDKLVPILSVICLVICCINIVLVVGVVKRDKKAVMFWHFSHWAILLLCAIGMPFIQVKHVSSTIFLITGLVFAYVGKGFLMELEIDDMVAEIKFSAEVKLHHIINEMYAMDAPPSYESISIPSLQNEPIEVNNIIAENDVPPPPYNIIRVETSGIRNVTV